jgi:choline dehydrogenase
MLQNTQSFQSIETKINPNSFPGCEDRQYLSYEYFECFVRSFTLAGSHASGTCAMGNSIGVGDSSRPPNSVVDSELKVITINGLRIADASVIPVIPNANIYWPCLMIGERAAQIILSDWI